MFGYLLLLFQLFLGGHFHMGFSGHPSDQNVGRLFYARNDLNGHDAGLKQVPLPEWEWHFGRLVFQGDLGRFFHMSAHQKTHYYLRSNATMWKEGISSLSILFVQCCFCIYLVKTYLSFGDDDITVCPVHSELQMYLLYECYFSIFSLVVCWVSCVRGVTSSRFLWIFFILTGVADIFWNMWGASVVVRGGANMCALSSPTAQMSAQLTVVISTWINFIIAVAIVRYFITARYVQSEAKQIVEEGMAAEERRILGEFSDNFKPFEAEADAEKDAVKSASDSAPAPALVANATSTTATAAAVPAAPESIEIATKKSN